MKVNTSMQIEVAPGTHEVRSNFSKDRPLTIDLQSGETYYLLAQMKGRPGDLRSQYELVTEDYAYELMPVLNKSLTSI
jgi:hypothetical protein